jgi:Protein of unknown function (DUF3105)
VATKRSSASKQSKAKERQERLRELQKQQKRVERRRNFLIFGATAVVALAIIGGTAYGIMQQNDDGSVNADSRLEPRDVGIDGVEYANITDSTHVEGDVDYPETPPIGGDHNADWQNCGFYSDSVADENAVHALEHGAVWITYSDDLSDGQVDQLRQLATPGAYILITPHDDLPSDIVASAWGYQLQLDSADDPRLQQFLEKFVQGEQTLEPGAACTGGTGEPEFSE